MAKPIDQMWRYAASALTRCDGVGGSTAARVVLRGARLALHDVPPHVLLAVESADDGASTVSALGAATSGLILPEAFSVEHRRLAAGASPLYWLQRACCLTQPPMPPHPIALHGLLLNLHKLGPGGTGSEAWDIYLADWDRYVTAVLPLVLEDAREGLDKRTFTLPVPGIEHDIASMSSRPVPASDSKGFQQTKNGKLQGKHTSAYATGGYTDVGFTADLERAAPWQFALGRRMVVRRMLDHSLVAYGKQGHAAKSGRACGLVALVDPSSVIDGGLRTSLSDYVAGKRLVADLLRAAASQAISSGLEDVSLGVCVLPTSHRPQMWPAGRLVEGGLPAEALFRREPHVVPAVQTLEETELSMGQAGDELLAKLLIDALDAQEQRPTTWSPLVVVSKRAWSVLNQFRHLGRALVRTKRRVDVAVTQATRVPTSCVLVAHSGDEVLATTAVRPNGGCANREGLLRDALTDMFDSLSSQAGTTLSTIEEALQ